MSPRLVKIFERDNGQCQICSFEVDPTLVVPHPRAPTLDHIIPRKRGGADALENLQLAHHACNGRKADRILPWQWNKGKRRPVARPEPAAAA